MSNWVAWVGLHVESILRGFMSIAPNHSRQCKNCISGGVLIGLAPSRSGQVISRNRVPALQLVHMGRGREDIWLQPWHPSHGLFEPSGYSISRNHLVVDFLIGWLVGATGVQYLLKSKPSDFEKSNTRRARTSPPGTRFLEITWLWF